MFAGTEMSRYFVLLNLLHGSSFETLALCWNLSCRCLEECLFVWSDHVACDVILIDRACFLSYSISSLFNHSYWRVRSRAIRLSV